MMKLITLLTAFLPPKIPQNPNIYKKSDYKEGVMRIESGNVLIQLGRYVLEEDIELLREEALARTGD